MSYYRYHLFFCTNQREDGKACCARYGAQKMRDYLKQRVKEQGLSGAGGVRVNSAGCMDRCDKGPVIVIYPEAIWYTFVDTEDIDEILEMHIKRGEVVERLLIK